MILIDELTSSAEVEQAIAQVVYDAVIHIFSQLEREKRIHGNSHHMAQRLGAAAAAELRERWKPVPVSNAGEKVTNVGEFADDRFPS